MIGRVYQGDNEDLREKGSLAGRAEMVVAGTPGKKEDAGKHRWYAMPLCVLNDLADTFNHGAEEYGLFNCLQEFEEPKQRWWNALMRHLEECPIDPLAKDETSGCYHAACVAFNALMYLYHRKRGAE